MEERGSRKKKMRVEKSENDGGFGYLPTDVLYHILSRFSVKTLCRFKCVSKSWLNMITHDPFVQLQMTRSKQNGTGRYLRHCTRRSNGLQVAKARYYKFDYKDEQEGRDVDFNVRVGKEVCYRFPTLPSPCNGLVCYMSSSYHIEVCNPFTHETITLPQPDFLRMENFEDLNLERVMLGIGYVSSEKIYKVVMAWSTPSDSGVEIFTLGGGTKFSSSSWRPVSCKQYGSLLSYPLSEYVAPVYINGALYWLTKYKYGDELRRDQLEIVSFNFAEEKFNLIPVPKDVVDHSNHLWIWELQGHLCLLEKTRHEALWWMLKKNHEWVTQKTTTYLITVRTIATTQNGYRSVVRQTTNKETLFVYESNGELIQTTNSIQSLPDDPSFREFCLEVNQFHQESLVSLTSM